MSTYEDPAELGRILIYEAAREWLPTVDAQVQTPLDVADATFVDPMQPIKVRCLDASRLAALPNP